MNRLFAFLCSIMLMVVLAGPVQAGPIWLDFTADNFNTFIVYQQNGGSPNVVFSSSLPYNDDWTNADSVTLDLEYGLVTTIIWNVGNYAIGSPTPAWPTSNPVNPTAFLGQIGTLGQFFTTDANSIWSVSFDGFNFVDPTSYALNGQWPWTTFVSGISGDAEWIGLGSYPGDACQWWVKAEFTPVPEPGTILLLGFGLLGLAIFGRKLRSKS